MENGFQIKSEFSPTGDQPGAIAELTEGVLRGDRHQVLLGVTGSGKTFTIANVIANVGRPTLIMAHNKTLAAQLYGELKDLFPDNPVRYFVSYYDYYQPEAYVPTTDTYIDKDSMINERLDRLRHSATRSLLDRQDVLIVASIIEREVFRSEDRAKVARVFYNRLKKGMPLQSDATVAYAVKKTGTIWTTAAERKNKSPYNTYLHKGLPPGPITAPAKAALEAAVNPEEGDWLYFVPVNLDTGETKFTNNYDDHLKALAELQAWCLQSAENKKKCS